MKFNFAYVKEHPYLFGGIAIGGVLLWLYLNHGASAASQTTVYNPNAGPSDAVVQSNNALAAAQLAASSQTSEAQIAAQMNQNIAQIQSNTQIAHDTASIAALAQQGQNDTAIANINANVNLANIASNERVSINAATLSAATYVAALNAQTSMNADNNATTVAIASKAYDTSVINTGIMADVYKQFSSDQLQATLGAQKQATIATLAANIGQAPETDRDQMLALITGAATGTGFSYHDQGIGTLTVLPANPTVNTAPIQNITNTNPASATPYVPIITLH